MALSSLRGPPFSTRPSCGSSTRTGWGIIQIDNFTPCTGKKFEELIEAAQKLAGITEEIVELGDVPHGILPVPPMKEDPRSVSIEEKSSLLAGIEEAARHPLVTNRRANYIERIEQVRFLGQFGQ